MEEPAEGLADDLTGRGVVSRAAFFDGCTKLGVEAYWDDLGWARAHGRATAARSKCGDVVAGFGLGGHALDAGYRVSVIWGVA